MKPNGRLKRERGFTLVELLVVISILAVLSAIVFPTVTGVNTTARGTAQPTDIQQMQTAVDRFNTDDNEADWPTKAPFTGGSGWSAGERPATLYSGSGSVTVPYTFTVNTIAGVAFTATAQTADGDKTFKPDFASKPKHADDTVDVLANATKTFTINRSGITVTIVLSNTTNDTTQTFDDWGIDSEGKVWVFVDKKAY